MKTLTIDGLTKVKALPVVLYVGGKGYESYFSLFDKNEKHIGFIKADKVKDDNKISFDDVII